MGTFIATIYTKLKLFFLQLFENLKILIVSAALPTILSVLIQLFVPNFDGTTFILFAALFLFTQGVKGSPKIQLKASNYPTMHRSLRMVFLCSLIH